MRHISFIPLLLCILILSFTAQAQEVAYDSLPIWSIEKNGQPAPMGLSLGQFANYLQSHKAEMSLLLRDNDLLELRVSDPRMNLHEHLIHTYVFELDKRRNRLICNHFLLNGQEMGGDAFQANATFLFRLVAGMGHKYPSSYNFQILKQIPEQTISNSDFYNPAQGGRDSSEICGKVLVNMPVNQTLSFILLQEADTAKPYFYLADSCQISSTLICARPLQKLKPDQQMRANGILLPELKFIHQCRPQRVQ